MSIGIRLLPDRPLVNIFGSLITLLLTVKGIVDIKHSITKSSLEQKDFNRKSMYDDEIVFQNVQ